MSIEIKRETTMAKAQRHGNREAKKPKAVKPPVVAAPPSLMTRGSPAPVGMPRKK
jgi:hypothetical protein